MDDLHSQYHQETLKQNKCLITMLNRLLSVHSVQFKLKGFKFAENSVKKIILQQIDDSQETHL
jgi:hypothetical protein